MNKSQAKLKIDFLYFLQPRNTQLNTRKASLYPQSFAWRQEAQRSRPSTVPKAVSTRFSFLFFSDNVTFFTRRV